MTALTTKTVSTKPMPEPQRSRLRQELREKLLNYRFSHFITLATNYQPIGYPRMRELLKAWDGRVNRAINGPKWQKRPDERLMWYAFPEKLDVNPHWHLLVEVDPMIETASRRARTRDLAEIGRACWVELVKQGTFDCQTVASKGVIDYVTKLSTHEAYFEKFVVSGEFANI